MKKKLCFLLFSMFCLTAPACFLESSSFAISSWHVFSQQSGTGFKNGVAKHSSLLPRIISAAKLHSCPFTHVKVDLHTHWRLWNRAYNLFKSESKILVVLQKKTGGLRTAYNRPSKKKEEHLGRLWHYKNWSCNDCSVISVQKELWLIYSEANFCRCLELYYHPSTACSLTTMSA